MVMKNREPKKYRVLISEARSFMLGVAMLAVMLYHLACGNFCVQPFLGETYCLKLGHWGVDLFLFLSGFGIYYSLQKHGKWWSFYSRRLWRIMPSCMLVGWFLIICSGRFSIDLATISRVFGLHEWYIRCIILFYAVAPILMWGVKKANAVVIAVFVVVLMAVISCLLAYSFCHSVCDINGSILGTVRGTLQFSLCRFPSFVLGFLMASSDKLLQGKELGLYLVVAAVSLLLAIWGHLMGAIGILGGYDEYVRVLSYVCLAVSLPLIAFGLGYLCSILPVWLVSVFSWMGTYSLEIFLIHWFVFATIRTLYPIECGGYTVIAFICSYGAAFILNRVVLCVVKYVRK